MAASIYGLCAVTAALCAWRCSQPTRGRASRSCCGAGCASACSSSNNALLVVDRVVLSDIDLFPLRLVTALLGISALLYGLIRDAK